MKSNNEEKQEDFVWTISKTGVPFIEKYGIMVILNDLTGENLHFKWFVLSLEFEESYKVAYKSGAKAGQTRLVKSKRRHSNIFPLGSYIKLKSEIRRHLNKEQKSFIRQISSWAARTPELRRKDLKIQK